MQSSKNINHQDIINNLESYIIEFLKDYQAGNITDDEVGLKKILNIAKIIYAGKPINDKNGNKLFLSVELLSDEESNDREETNAFYDSNTNIVKLNKNYIKAIIHKTIDLNSNKIYSISTFLSTLFHEREHARQKIMIEAYVEAIKNKEISYDQIMDQLKYDYDRKNLTKMEFLQIEKIISTFIGKDNTKNLMNINDLQYSDQQKHAEEINNVITDLSYLNYRQKLSEVEARRAGYEKTEHFLNWLEKKSSELSSFISQEKKYNIEDYQAKQEEDKNIEKDLKKYTDDLNNVVGLDFIIYDKRKNNKEFDNDKTSKTIECAIAENYIMDDILRKQDLQGIISEIIVALILDNPRMVIACLKNIENRGKIDEKELKQARIKLKEAFMNTDIALPETSLIYNFSSILTTKDIADIEQALIKDGRIKKSNKVILLENESNSEENGMQF